MMNLFNVLKRVAIQPLLSLCVIGCGGSVIQRIDEVAPLPIPPQKQGFLKLPKGPPQTKIYLDERFIGRFADYPRDMILLPVGQHLLKLSAKGHATIYATINVSGDHPVSFKRGLVKRPSYDP